MTFVAINAITVPEGSGEELAKRFAARAGQVDTQPGFEGFELLRPADEHHRWLVVTRWSSRDAFESWVKSPAFGQGHARPEGASTPVASGAELWTFEVEQQSQPGR